MSISSAASSTDSSPSIRRKCIELQRDLDVAEDEAAMLYYDLVFTNNLYRPLVPCIGQWQRPLTQDVFFLVTEYLTECHGMWPTWERYPPFAISSADPVLQHDMGHLNRSRIYASRPHFIAFPNEDYWRMRTRAHRLDREVQYQRARCRELSRQLGVWRTIVSPALARTTGLLIYNHRPGM